MAAMFQKRHYEVIAQAILETRNDPDSDDTRARYAIGRLEARLTEIFMADNHNFDGQKFADAARGTKYHG